MAVQSSSENVPAEETVSFQLLQGDGWKLDHDRENGTDEDWHNKTYPDYTWCVVRLFDSTDTTLKTFVQELNGKDTLKKVKETILNRLGLTLEEIKQFSFFAPRTKDTFDRTNRVWRKHFLEAGEVIWVSCLVLHPSFTNDALEAIPEGDHPIRPFPLKVMYHTEPFILDDIDTSTPIQTIFDKVATKLKLDVKNFDLMFDRRFYENEKNTYFLENKGTVRDHFVSCSFQKMFLNVVQKMPEDKTINIHVKRDRDSDGMTFNVNSQETDFTDVADLVAEKLGITVDDFLTQFQFFDEGKKLVHHYRRVAEFIVPNDTKMTVYLRPYLRGGGSSKVMKHVLKRNIPPMRTEDQQNFANTFQTAMMISNSTTYDLQRGINELPPQDLNELKEMLAKGNRAPNASKIERLIEGMMPFKQLEMSIQKIMTSMEQFKNLVGADIEKNYLKQDGGYDMEKLREMIAVAFAMKTNSTSSG